MQRVDALWATKDKTGYTSVIQPGLTLSGRIGIFSVRTKAKLKADPGIAQKTGTVEDLRRPASNRFYRLPTPLRMTEDTDHAGAMHGRS